MNKITILGSGDTLGTPLAGCNSESCVDTDSRSKRYRFGLLIEISGKKILIDTSPDLKWQCLQSHFELKDIDAVLITHTHSDHINGMGEFFYRRQKPIPTYYLDHPITRKHLDYFRYLEKENILKFISYENYVPLMVVDNVKVTAIELNHGFPCSGFVIESDGVKIGIVSDTNFNLKQESLKTLDSCNYLFADAFSEDTKQVENIYRDCGIDVPNLELEWFHMTMSEAQKLSAATNSKRLYTVHMSRFVSPYQQLVRKYQTDEFIIGYDNQEIVI